MGLNTSKRDLEGGMVGRAMLDVCGVQQISSHFETQQQRLDALVLK